MTSVESLNILGLLKMVFRKYTKHLLSFQKKLPVSYISPDKFPVVHESALIHQPCRDLVFPTEISE